jgi:hypothetical protein
MKKSVRLFRVAGTMMVGLAVVVFVAAASMAVPKKADLPRTTVAAPTPPPCDGPDLYITQSSVKVEKINGQWWVVTRAVVANKGTRDYDGKINQAIAQLILRKSWDPAHPTIMTTANITHLAKGAGRNAGGSFLLSDYVRAGCTPPLGRNECCREVQILLNIVFDPDIRSDGNPNNDDCDPSNNSLADTPNTHIKYVCTCLRARQ